MTPEEWARIAVPCFGPPHCTGNDHDYECDRHDPERFNRAVEQISAALRERDAAKAEEVTAFRDQVLGLIDDLRSYARDWDWKYGDWWDRERGEIEAVFAKRLRALLEEAGK